ncbi:MAG: hypothetical protein Q8N22_02105 [bacterium]|nr:hypothetical protein [bacterium]
MKTLKSGLIILVVIAFLTGAYFVTTPKKQSIPNENSPEIKLTSLPTPEPRTPYNFDEKNNTVKALGENLFEEIQNNNLVNQEKRTLSPDINTASENLVNKVINDSLSDFKLVSTVNNADLKISSEISKEAKTRYLKAIGEINKITFGDFNENYLQVIVDTYQKIDPSSANRLAGIYKNLADQYLNLTVPADWVDIHKMMIVYAKNSAVVYRAMAYYPTDPPKGGLALEAMDSLVSSGEKIQTILGEKIKEIGS